MKNLNETINRIKTLINHNSGDLITEQDVGEIQDITGPIALAGALQDCFVYAMSTASKNIQKYKSTGEKDILYSFVEEGTWENSSEGQNAKFQKAIGYFDSNFKGGVFKAKPWESVEKAAADIKAAMSAIDKTYCESQSDETDPGDQQPSDWPEEFACVGGFQVFKTKSGVIGRTDEVDGKKRLFYDNGRVEIGEGSGDMWDYSCKNGKLVVKRGVELDDVTGGEITEEVIAKLYAAVAEDGYIDEGEMKVILATIKKYDPCKLNTAYATFASKYKNRGHGYDLLRGLSIIKGVDPWKTDAINLVKPCTDGGRSAEKQADKESFMSDKFLGPDAEFIFSQVTSANINKNEMKQIHDVVKKYEKDGSICDLIAKYAEVASKKEGSLGQTPDTWKSGMLSHIAGIAFWGGNQFRKGVKDMIKKANCS